MSQTVGVYSDRTDLVAALRQKCPAKSFSTEADRDSSRIVILDSDHAALFDNPPRKSLVRIILGEHDPRRHGELVLQRDAFLASPATYLDFASDLADAAIHAAQLEAEVGYLTQIHELMSMVEAKEVSERITRTVLNILGFSRGTLFLHDPRLERYVVSFSNDSNYHETGEFLPGIPPDLLQRALSSGRFIALDREAGMIVMPLQF